MRRSAEPRRPATLLSLAGVLLLGAASCGGEVAASSETGSPEVSTSSGGPGFLELSVDAPWTVAFRGVRRVALHHVSPGVEYREEVGSDGQGQFAIDTLEVLSPHPDPELFKALMDLRQTLSYRYRDFGIDDWDLFQQNYVVVIVDEDRTVAGVPAVRVRVERRVDGRSIYLVDFDPDNGLVLAYQEYDTDGVLLADVAFESLEYDADLSGMDLVSHLYPTTSHALDSGSLDSVFSFEPLVPKYLPTGFQLQDEIERQDAPDAVRAKVFLSDGLETVILTSRRPTASSGPAAERVAGLDLGTWSGLMGELKGHPFLVAGKCARTELELVVQSAIDE